MANSSHRITWIRQSPAGLLRSSIMDQNHPPMLGMLSKQPTGCYSNPQFSRTTNAPAGPDLDFHANPDRNVQLFPKGSDLGVSDKYNINNLHRVGKRQDSGKGNWWLFFPISIDGDEPEEPGTLQGGSGALSCRMETQSDPLLLATGNGIDGGGQRQAAEHKGASKH
ncbi:hypothetical protein AAES_143415 [Amazona aestiva]|uniref:Uncharacterized protein n=1 Tax=Amazona aestiva TaxID=12930 RepID=A0A0Q3LYP7_AMAAE|nr:hypothetical protein AAES_143415 [Amazona aestiva]